MARIEIECVCEQNGVITGVNCVNIGYLSTSSIIIMINMGNELCITGPGSNKTATLYIYNKKFIKTKSDGVEDNNLDHLPKCKDCNSHK